MHTIKQEHFQSVFPPPEVKFGELAQDLDADWDFVMEWIIGTLPGITNEFAAPSPRIKQSLKLICVKESQRFIETLISTIRKAILPQIQNLLKMSHPISTIVKYIEYSTAKISFLLKSTFLETNDKSYVWRKIVPLFRMLLTPAPVSDELYVWLRNRYAADDPAAHREACLYASLLDAIGMSEYLNQALLDISRRQIAHHVTTKYSTVWDRPILSDSKNYINIQLYPKLTALSGNVFDENVLSSLMRGEIVQLRVSESLDMICNFPSSTVALEELYQCITTSAERSELVEQFIILYSKHLLHAGSNSADIIKFYTTTIKAFLIIDPRGVLLDKVCRPIRNYLRDREDTIQIIVSALLDVTDNNPLKDLAYELRSGKFGQINNEIRVHEIDDLKDLNWVLIPIDALPDFKRNRIGDIIESLISLFESKDVFLGEFVEVFAKRLLGIPGYQVGEIVHDLKLLKSRFGNSEFDNLDVMVRDIQESEHLYKIIGAADLKLEPKIISHLYWPETVTQDLGTGSPNFFPDLEAYRRRYAAVQRGRRLELIPNAGLVSLEVELRDGTLEFDVPVSFAAVICMLQDCDTSDISMEEMCLKLEATENDVLPAVEFWVNSKVLFKSENGNYGIAESL